MNDEHAFLLNRFRVHKTQDLVEEYRDFIGSEKWQSKKRPRSQRRNNCNS